MTQRERKIFNAGIEILTRLADDNAEMIMQIMDAGQREDFDAVISMLTDCANIINQLRGQLTRINALYVGR